MQLVSGSRNSGKSYSLVKYVGSKDLVIVCPNQGSCNYVKHIAKKQGITLKYEPITIKNYMRLIGESSIYVDTKNKLTTDRSGKRFDGGFVCDNIEHCLNAIGINFELVTGTIPTTHPSSLILYEDMKGCINMNNLHQEMLGEFKYE